MEIADDLPEARALTLLRALVPLWQGPYVLLADARREVAEDIIALEAGSPTGLRGLLGGGAKHDAQDAAAGGTEAALVAAGFRPVRTLGDR